MTRLALISDSHFDASSRLEECVSVHNFIADDCARRKIDLTLHGGDLFERRSCPEDEKAAAGWLQRMAESAKIIGVYGNHDHWSAEGHGDLDVLTKLDARFPIVWNARPCVEVDLENNVQIACMPWPRRGSARNSAEPMRDILRGLGAEMDKLPGTHRIFLSHAMIQGSKTSAGQPLMGCDYEIGLEDLALVRADVYLLGHVHMRNQWSIGGAPCFYPGSPRRTAFGELEEKGYAIVDLEHGKPPRVEFVPTPCRPMVMVEASWEPGAGFGDQIHTMPRGAEVRLRFSVDREHQAAAMRDAVAVRDQWLSLGNVHSVKLDPQVNVTTRARAPEIAVAKTLQEQVYALWKSRNTVPDDATGERLTGRLLELEAEVQA